jgi:hypothetical protein
MPRLAALFIAVALALAGCTQAEIIGGAGSPTIRLTQVGGRVKISDPVTGNEAIRANNEKSFTDLTTTIDKAATKVFGWKVFDRALGRLDTRDTIEAAAARDADAAELARLNAGNQHSLQVLEAEQAFELEQAALP